MTFPSILFAHPADRRRREPPEAPACFGDLALDRIVAAVTAGKKEYTLQPFLHAPLQEVDAVRFRQEVARDLEDPALVESRVRVLSVTHLYELARGFYVAERENVLFLSAERREGGARTFKLREGKPLPTSFGEDLYERIFTDEEERTNGLPGENRPAGPDTAVSLAGDGGQLRSVARSRWG